jgi:glycosyltransferase involved in cell wall biosynthesis
VRVLNTLALLDPVMGGGAAERTIQLSRAFAQAGMETTVLTTATGVTPELRARLGEARLEALPVLLSRFDVPSGGRDRIRAIVRGADVVHLCNHWTTLNAMVYRVARAEAKPYAVCPAGALPIAGRSLALKRLYNLVVGRRLIASADARIAITLAETEDFRAYGADPASVDVIPNGIDPAEYREAPTADFRRRTGLGERNAILFLGRLNPIKGPDLLLEAFKRVHADFPNHALVFAGPDMGMRRRLEREVSDSGMQDKVHFTGYIAGAGKVAALRAAQLLVVPSRREAMSLVALEAGACGLPVLMTDQCGFPAAEAAGGARIVPADAGSLATALAELLSQPARLSAMGEAMRRLVLENYTWTAATARYRDLFQRIR